MAIRIISPRKQCGPILATCALGLIVAGCSQNVSDHSDTSQSECIKGFYVPEAETIETPRFVKLKKEVDLAKRSVERLSNARDLLLAKYTEFHPLVKRNSVELKQALRDLNRLSNDLTEENKKLQHRWVSPPV